MKIIIKDNRYIPFLNTFGPILTPVKVPRELYERLVNGGIRVEIFEEHMPTIAKAKEVVKVTEEVKVTEKEAKAIRFEDLAATPAPVVEPIVEEVTEEAVVEEIIEEVVEEVVEEVEYVEEVVEEVVEEIVEEEQPARNSSKKKKKSK